MRARGKGCIESGGYVQFCHLGKRLHQLIAEKALGKPLPVKAIVHHVNYDKSDNRHENLVICNNQAYHILVHQRTNAYNACGNANWRKCPFCKQYGDPETLIEMRSNTGTAYAHRICKISYRSPAQRGK